MQQFNAKINSQLFPHRTSKNSFSSINESQNSIQILTHGWKQKQAEHLTECTKKFFFQQRPQLSLSGKKVGGAVVHC